MRIADTNPGAITGVWATSNTRGAIWDAMLARETFATSGPRLKVRMFAGRGFAPAYDSYETLVADGSARGVPMGGDYTGDEAPQLLVWAIKDPIGPNLDRIQIVKGWIENGEIKDAVYNVAASGNRLRQDGTVEPIDAPIDPKTGQFDTEQGSPELTAVWTDPGYDPRQHAYYYVRVLQLPTARWTFYDELEAGVEYPDDVKREIVERAWGSPIWHDAH